LKDSPFPASKRPVIHMTQNFAIARLQLSNALQNHAAYDPEPHERNSLKTFQGKVIYGRWEKEMSENRRIFVHGPVVTEPEAYILLLKLWNRSTYIAE
jgi:hypothetical protein